MSGLKILYNLILKNVAKESGQASGILSIGKDVRKLADKKFQRYVTTAQKQGVDLDKLSEQEIKYMMELNKPKAPQVLSNEEAYEFLNKFLNQGKKDKGKVIKGKFGKSFLEELSSADNAADDILVEQMYRTSGPRDLETDFEGVDYDKYIYKKVKELCSKYDTNVEIEGSRLGLWEYEQLLELGVPKLC